MTPARAAYLAINYFSCSRYEWLADKADYDWIARRIIAAYEALPPKKKRKFRKRARKTG